MNKSEIVDKMTMYIIAMERLQQTKKFSNPMSDNEVINAIKIEIEKVTKNEDK